MNFNTERKSKKKLYTEKIPNTPEVLKPIKRDVNTTTKKSRVKKVLSVTELVNNMKDDVDLLTNKVKKVSVADSVENVKRLSFMGSLAGKIY